MAFGTVVLRGVIFVAVEQFAQFGVVTIGTGLGRQAGLMVGREFCVEFGDIHDNLPQLGDYMRDNIDAWFLDGFAPSKNPDMWNDALYTQMYRYTKPQGTFATFTEVRS